MDECKFVIKESPDKKEVNIYLCPFILLELTGQFQFVGVEVGMINFSGTFLN